MRGQSWLLRLRRAPGLAAGLLILLGMPGAALCAPAVELHDLTWHVHIDLIDAGAGRDLAFWQDVIDDAMAEASQLVEGGQGPFDQACCSRLVRSVPVVTFGTPNDGFDIIDSEGEQNALAGIGGSGSDAFLVDRVQYCGGSAPTAIGCAIEPPCNGNGNDDPSLWMVVSVDAYEETTLPAVIAHERGHNACLVHVADAECQIMQGTVFTPGQGGCLSSSECSNFQAARTTTFSGLECGCLDNAGDPEPDGTYCEDQGVGGLCSGGLHGGFATSAGVQLHVAADPGVIPNGPPDNLLSLSALSGDWSDQGALSGGSPTNQIRAMAWATDSETLYAIAPTTLADSLYTLDPATGTLLSFVGSIDNAAQEITAMAYDPGPTNAPGDDRLIVLEVDGSSGEFRWIDPAAPSVANLLGSLPIGPAGEITGLAYDSLQDKLFASSFFGPDGLYEVDLTSCPPSPCNMAQLPGAQLAREDASLGYSAVSGLLYMVGTSFSRQRTFYNVIDPTNGASVETLSLDLFTPAALAAVPEPSFATGLSIGALVCCVTAARRRRAKHPGRV